MLKVTVFAILKPRVRAAWAAPTPNWAPRGSFSFISHQVLLAPFRFFITHWTSAAVADSKIPCTGAMFALRTQTPELEIGAARIPSAFNCGASAPTVGVPRMMANIAARSLTFWYCWIATVGLNCVSWASYLIL